MAQVTNRRENTRKPGTYLINFQKDLRGGHS